MLNDPKKLVALIVSVVAIILIAVLIVILVTHKHIKDNVYKHSEPLKKLRELNNKYSFEKAENKNILYKTDNRDVFDGMPLKSYFTYYLKYNMNDINGLLNKVDTNQEKFTKYIVEVNSIDSFGKFKSKREAAIEKLYFNNETIYPLRNLSITITLQLIDAQGHSYGMRHETYVEDDIKARIKSINNKNGDIYNEPDVWADIAAIENSFITLKVRETILARDGKKCLCCGDIDHGYNLIIDHIVPIIKGGTSDLDNLQTLCRNCDAAKGEQIINYRKK